MIDLRNLRAVVATTALFAMGACSELEVVNPNEPERDRALASAADVESLISGQFRSYWSLSQGNGDTNGSAASALDAFAGAIVSSSANNSTQYAGDLPPAAMPNVKGDRWARGFRDPWLVQNRALAAIRSGLQAKDELGLVIEDPARLDAFAKLMQGLFHGQIALLYDRGFVIDETVDDVAALTLLPYDQVMTAARGYLAEARTIAGANSFNTPQGWLGPASYTSDDLVELAHSYEARFMAQIARTPAERAAVNWAEVITHVNSGVTEDFGVELDGPGGIWGSSYKGQSGTGMSVGLTFLGPADQSGGVHRVGEYACTGPDRLRYRHRRSPYHRRYTPGPRRVHGVAQLLQQPARAGDLLPLQVRGPLVLRHRRDRLRVRRGHLAPGTGFFGSGSQYPPWKPCGGAPDDQRSAREPRPIAACDGRRRLGSPLCSTSDRPAHKSLGPGRRCLRGSFDDTDIREAADGIPAVGGQRVL